LSGDFNLNLSWPLSWQFDNE